jgi:tripartite-type tricarboxylate transporter receptor subunit TctC
MRARNSFAVALLAVAALMAPLESTAQPYPSKPVRLIVAFPPGGANDIIARSVAQRLSERLGQQMVVENRPGASGALGAEVAAKSPPDGYTLFVAAINHVVLPSIVTKVPYDIERDFTPVVLLATVPIVVTVHPSLPAKSIPDLIALAKAKPGALNYASSGNGGGTHLAGELFKMQAGVNLTHVPYKGSGPAMTDLIGGQVQLMFADLPSATSQIRGGKLRALAVGSPHASALVPDLPTVSASGLPGYEAYTWVGIMAPAGTPRDVVMRLNTEAVAALGRQDLKDALAAQGAEAAPGTPEQFGAHVKSEMLKWALVVKTAGIKAD